MSNFCSFRAIFTINFVPKNSNNTLIQICSFILSEFMRCCMNFHVKSGYSWKKMKILANFSIFRHIGQNFRKIVKHEKVAQDNYLSVRWPQILDAGHRKKDICPNRRSILMNSGEKISKIGQNSKNNPNSKIRNSPRLLLDPYGYSCQFSA